MVVAPVSGSWLISVITKGTGALIRSGGLAPLASSEICSGERKLAKIAKSSIRPAKLLFNVGPSAPIVIMPSKASSGSAPPAEALRTPSIQIWRSPNSLRWKTRLLPLVGDDRAVRCRDHQAFWAVTATGLVEEDTPVAPMACEPGIRACCRQRGGRGSRRRWSCRRRYCTARKSPPSRC